MFLPFLSGTKVYAALGNHDFHPKNQLPAQSNSIYTHVAELWRPWLSNESFTLFKEGTNDACALWTRSVCQAASDSISSSLQALK